MLRKKIYMTAGYNTISLGTGRNEFHPKKPRPDIEHYIKEAGEGTMKKLKNPEAIDESVVGNFMAPRYNKQGHLGAFAPMISPMLLPWQWPNSWPKPITPCFFTVA